MKNFVGSKILLGEKNLLGNKNLVPKTMLVVLFPLLCLTLGAPASVLNKQGGVLL